MQTPASRKRMIAIGTVVVIGLCAAVVWVTPPEEAPAPVDAPAPDAPAPDAPQIGCATGGGACVAPDPFCYTAPSVEGGVCTRTCSEGEGCRAGWCCVDHLGQGDPRYFVCAPPAVCADPQTRRARQPDGPR